MTIIKSLDEVLNIENTVVTIGNFDGIHKGHTKLIEEAVKEAKLNNYKSVVFTFENHPMRYFRANSIKNIIVNEEKIKIFKELGVDIVFMIPFDEYMTKISPKDFVKEILHGKLKCKKVIVGHDFTFARNKEGNASLLKTLGKNYAMNVKIIEPIKIKGTRVSSSYIRKLIDEGNVSEIKEFLGRNYSIEGEVIHAKKFGRTMGFPTANLKVDDKLIIPKNGIYAVRVYVKNEVYYGATNIGYNPTVNGKSLSIETNIIDFDKDIYGEIIKVEFLDRIRYEKKFNSIDELKSQLRKDVNFVCKKYVYK
ncbi:bifunctional riboflavin kinase/FAD synthetase [Paraclostridium ghonii]|uniref:bifunctional riboflavin kinase/FAD synthetase n=1 Tax=Paraclostridium ghonii TaxID=29358 RepID=UPI00202D0548|nr:bifunctional riboflavin kinase/FAD synthetase [Paeniclostridium ghonii]MCM0164929.1 bifunctional riboflavin kinase/FAD synthetase [Paeniclostridium ghonii]